MLINTIFKNEVEVIESTINNMQMERCLVNFSEYIRNKAETGAFEKQFRTNLCIGLAEFVIDIFMQEYLYKSPDELLKTIRSFMIDGYSSVSDWIHDDTLTNILDTYTDDFLYTHIREYMRTTLEATKAECIRSKEQIAIHKLEKELQTSENLLKTYTAKVESLKHQLGKEV